MTLLPADYHMHTPLCRHAVGEPIAYAAQAVAQGLTEIGFSDHSPMARDDFDDWRMKLSDLDDYVARVQLARDAHPGLAIRLALEVDYLPGHESWIQDLAGRHPWDYFIGSVHYVSESWDLDNPAKLSEWRKRDAWDVWRVYFDRLTEAAGSGLFNILGHADLCKKFAFIPERDCTSLFAPFLDAAAATGTAMELNTAGLRKECREIYPAPVIVRMAAERGVPLTFGSDAHAPEEVGLDFDKALTLARDNGHTHWVRFSGRQQERVPLPAA